MKNLKSFITLAACLALGFGCGGESSNDGTVANNGVSKPLQLAYVTNGVDPFWVIAEAGVKAADAEFEDVETTVMMPPKGVVDQKRMVESLLTRGVDGIAISPIDAQNQVDFLNQVAAQTTLITQDSDAPDCDRVLFLGMNNYKAGRDAGKLLKEALPDGGKVMIFVGRLEQLNAQQRRQGVIDELLDRPEQDLDDMKFEAPGDKPSNDKYQIVGTLTDNFDYAKAKSNTEDAMTSHPDLGAVVGLFAYNIPNCLAAVKEAGKIGQIKLVSFDEADDTLRGIQEGSVHGTVSQQPYKYGYDSIRVLRALNQGDTSVIPEDKFIEINSIVVKKDNVDEFWAELKKLKGE